jgi:phosphopantetheinyl transferase
VAVWLADRTGKDAACGLAPDPDTQERTARLIDPQRAGDIRHARALVRRLVAACEGCAPDAVTLARTQSGAPFLSGHQHLAVSWSHSGPLALAACQRGGQIGVDIEGLERIPQGWRSMLDLVAAPSEAGTLLALDDAVSRTGFLRLWTLKEAVLKARGTGFRADPRTILLPEALLACDGQGEVDGLRIHVATLSEPACVIALATSPMTAPV